MIEQEINNYWKRIINTISEGLVLIGPDGTILMANEAFEELMGYDANEILGRSCSLLHCDACNKLLPSESPHWCTLFSEEFTKKCHCNMFRKDGTCIQVIKNSSVLRDENENILGAVETITDMSELVKLDQEVAKLSLQLSANSDFLGMIGKSAEMQKVFELITRASENTSPIIIFGESGTGKELVAHAIHRLGLRKNKPFIQLNCAALSESLIESELFGHIKGAFTGASQHRIGRFEAANGGDIFLDEIGDIPLSVQVKLLRVLESKKIERVGDNQPLHVDTRLITATNRNLYEMIEQRKFREDFFFRINVIPIHLPPLRKRTEDIPLLINSFLQNLKSQTGKNISGLSSSAMECLMGYHWPGNIRELKSTLEYAFVIADSGHIEKAHLPPQIIESSSFVPPSFIIPEQNNLQEKQLLISALKQCRGNQSKAARILNISRVTVWNRIKKYGIDLDTLFEI